MSSIRAVKTLKSNGQDAFLGVRISELNLDKAYIKELKVDEFSLGNSEQITVKKITTTDATTTVAYEYTLEDNMVLIRTSINAFSDAGFTGTFIINNKFSQFNNTYSITNLDRTTYIDPELDGITTEWKLINNVFTLEITGLTNTNISWNGKLNNITL